MTEERFTKLLPEYLRQASSLYFTPIHIARIAAQWLTEGEKRKVLDIGAGVGKFCIVGAKHTNSHFYGIEYRPSLAKLANELIQYYNIENATVLHKNIVEVDFSKYDAFYIYNPFYENLVASMGINKEVTLTGSLYGYYFNYTEQQLSKTKPGTRLVTYHGNNFEVPENFEKAKETPDGRLKLWIKS